MKIDRDKITGCTWLKLMIWLLPYLIYIQTLGYNVVLTPDYHDACTSWSDVVSFSIILP